MYDLHGIIFAYSASPELGELVRRRTAASIPFCGRYRLIDFALSSMMNAGIRDVGVIMQRDYQSLLDHIGSGKNWDMSRRYGGRGVMAELKQQCAEKGYAYVDWNVCAEDAVGGKPSAGTIYRNVVRETGEQTQCIVLMHDSATTRTTAEALPDIIQWYRDQGFTFCRVEQVLPAP